MTDPRNEDNQWLVEKGLAKMYRGRLIPIMRGGSEDEGEGAEGVDRPDWLPSNFDSPESLVTSYTEAQRKITETSQSLAEERRAREALEESVQQLSAQFEAQNRPDPNTVYSQWEDAYNSDPITTMAQIAQATAENLLKQQGQNQSQAGATPDVVAFIADQTMNQNHDDWGDYKGKVGELIAQNPLFQRDELWTNPQSATQAFDTAYKMVKAEAYLSGDPAVQQQLADTRQMKLGAQSAVGAAGRPSIPSDDAAEWAAVKAAQPKNYWE